MATTKSASSKTYKATSGMKSAVRSAKRRRDKLKKRGIKNLPTTRVGLERGNQILRGEAMSFSTVKRMFSFFSRHEENMKRVGRKDPMSKVSISWGFWGGNAGFSWSRGIVNREKRRKEREKAKRRKSSITRRSSRGKRSVRRAA